MVEEIWDILGWGLGILGWDHQVWRCGFGGLGFGTLVSLFLRLSSSPFRGCCEFGLMFFRPGRLPGGGHCALLWSLRDPLRRGFRIGLVGGIVVV